MNKVIILLGPTGVGKTGVSLLLAKELSSDIISADSMQIYRHMDIGTAKPTPEDRAAIRHHMVDIVDPWDSFSAGKYVATVVPIIENLHKKGAIPIVAGGTGLYIKAMTRGIFSGPSADWPLRRKLLSMEQGERKSLYSYLDELDPAAARNITQNDTRRIVRALEVCLKGDGSMSEMQKKLTRPLPYDFVKIGLTRDRKELYRLIESRIDKMIEDGLVDEVRKIIDSIHKQCDRNDKSLPYPLPLASCPLPSMQAIGYKEIAMYLAKQLSLNEAIELVKGSTKRYAKRQFTWFKKEEGIQWVDLTGVYNSHEAFDRVCKILKVLVPDLNSTVPLYPKNAIHY